MRLSKEDKDIVKDQLEYIDEHFDFSETCPAELQDYMLEEGLVDIVDDVPMLTYTGQLLVGYSKESLQDIYDDEGENNDY